MHSVTLSSPWFFAIYTYFINRFRGIHFSDFAHSLIQIYDRLSRLQICMNSKRKHREKNNPHYIVKSQEKGTEKFWRQYLFSRLSRLSSLRPLLLPLSRQRPIQIYKKTPKGWLQPGTQAATLRAGTSKNPDNLNWPGTPHKVQIWWV